MSSRCFVGLVERLVCLFLIVGCSDEPTVESSMLSTGDAGPSRDATPLESIPEPDLGLAPPERGLQIESLGTVIEPGQDVEYCEIAELPGDSNERYFVSGVELATAPYSHHFKVSVAPRDGPVDAELREYQIGDRIECFSAAVEWGTEGLNILAGAQTPYASAEYPKGAGVVLGGGERVVFDYHYINTTSAPIRAKSVVNLHTTSDDEIEHIATGFEFVNFTIDTPAMSAASFTGECAFKNDVEVGTIQRHTHGTGTDFTVWYSGGPKDGELLWKSEDWQDDIGYNFPEPYLFHAGEGLRFECSFENPTNSRIRYGIKASDEMCILAGTLWSAGDELRAPSQDCEVTWVDEDGIGHPAAAESGFPVATPTEAAFCRSGYATLAPEGSREGECRECMCAGCGGVLIDCFRDEDCAALLNCFSEGCSSETECLLACREELNDHSSAMGLIKQVSACTAFRCPNCGLD